MDRWVIGWLMLFGPLIFGAGSFLIFLGFRESLLAGIFNLIIVTTMITGLYFMTLGA